MHKDHAYIELSFAPNPKRVSTVRRFIADFCDQVLSDGDAASQLSVAAHELLENAVSYSTDNHAKLSMQMSRTDTLINVTIRTWNTASAQSIANAKRIIDDLTAAPDKEAYLQALMVGASKRAASGLGLARIAVECGMDLSCQIDGDVLNLIARLRTQSAAPATR